MKYRFFVALLSLCFLISMVGFGACASGVYGEVPYVKSFGEGRFVYQTPSFDGIQIMALNKGSYTILSETYDFSGNLWGELKSGAGWVCLDDVEEFPAGNTQGVHIYDFGFVRGNKGNYVTYSPDPNSEYSQSLCIQAMEDLSSVLVFEAPIHYGGDTPLNYVLASHGALAKGQGMVVNLQFVGHGSGYLVMAVSANGAVHSYYVYESTISVGGEVDFQLVRPTYKEVALLAEGPWNS